MQPDELEFRVGQDVGRQRATCVVGCIDDDALVRSALSARIAICRQEPTTNLAAPALTPPRIDATARPECMTMCIGSIPAAMARSSSSALVTSTVTPWRRIHAAGASNPSNAGRVADRDALKRVAV